MIDIKGTISSSLGPVLISDGMSVSGSTTLGGGNTDATTIAGPATLQSSLDVTGATTLSSHLTVNGDTVLGSAGTDSLTVKAEATLESSLAVSGAATLSGDVILGDAATDDIDIQGTIKNTAGNVKIVSPVDLSQGLTVDGALTGNGRWVRGCAEEGEGHRRV